MKLFKKIFTISLAICVVLSLYTLVPKAAGDTQLRFNSDGSFKIMVFADCQDDASPHQEMIDMIGASLDYEKPDLVVFTGDNVVVSSNSNFLDGARKIIQPLTDRNIPFAYTFGNHDDEYGVTKEYMHGVFTALGTCLTYDAQPSLNGFGNCNIPIYSSDGEDIAFNLWMIDSLTYADGGYDHVREDQIEWYKQTSIALENQVGHKVNSIMFQHIALPEIYNLLTESTSGSKTYLGKRYSLNLNSNASGYLGEFPCPPEVNGGQFDALVERGDVLGVVTGHDHSNAFHGTYQGIGFLQMPGMSFESYGDDNCRGYGVIELDENNTDKYLTHTVSYVNFWNGMAGADKWNNTGHFGGSSGTYISSVNFSYGSSASDAKSQLTNAGYTVIDKDLNADAGGEYIYLGYKTTTDHTKALRDLRFYVDDSGSSTTTVQCTVNGIMCPYTMASDVDLNKGAGGEYIYAFVSYDENAGPPIKSISFGSTTATNLKVCGTLISAGQAAELNAGAGGEYIYCYLDTLQPIKIEELISKTERAEYSLSRGGFYANSESVLARAMEVAGPIVQTLKNNQPVAETQQDIDSLCDSIDAGFTFLICRVDFVNYDSSEVESMLVPYGASVQCSVVPQKPSDEQYHYSFVGWDKNTSVVLNGMTVRAIYEAEHYHSSDAQATCTADEICRFCGEILNRAKGHGKSIMLNVSTASCETDGYTGDECCADCGVVISAGETIATTGHNYGDWVYYIMPTLTQNGTDRATCSNCKKTSYRESPKATIATVNEKIIYGFRANLSANDINSYFDLRYLTVNKQPYNGKVMGTNSVISVTQKNITTDYTVVIFGDVNGDGWYDGQDAVIVSCLAEGMLTREDVSEAEYMAADCNHDGIVDSFDVELLNKAGSLIADVDQSKTDIELQTSSVYCEYLELIDQLPEPETQTQPDETEQNTDIVTMVFEFIRKILELFLSYIPVYLI